jgi:hypothetical protein
MLHEGSGHEDNGYETAPRLLRVLVFFSKYPELLAILLVVILALVTLLLTVLLQ